MVSCKIGQVLRVAYKKKNGTKVKATCILDRGKSGKGPRLIMIKDKGALGKYGYSTGASLEARHRALKSAVRAYGLTSVKRKLVAVRTLNRNTAPKSSRIFGSDVRWLTKTYSR